MQIEEVTSLPGLDPKSMRAFRFAPDRIAVVQITRGVMTDTVTPFKVVAWLVDDAGDPVLVDGVQVRIPAAYVSIMNGALAGGQITLQNELATATLNAVERLRNHHAAMLAWARLPSASEEAGQ